jgi:hypothetical protein
VRGEDAVSFNRRMPDRQDDLALLRELLGRATCDGYAEEEHEAFEDMLERLGPDSPPRAPNHYSRPGSPRLANDRCLTDKQRAWAESVADRLGISWGDPAVRNARVPRGREVELAVDSMPRPKRPPGQSAVCMKCGRQGCRELSHGPQLKDASRLLDLGEDGQRRPKSG